MNGRLLYTFLSSAVTRDIPRGKVVPVEGIKVIGALAHKYDIPVTWIVDSQSAEESKNLLLEGHVECGDDVILQVDISRALKESGVVKPASKAEEIVIFRQKLPGIISSEFEKVRGILPWAEVRMIAADLKTEVLIEVLEDLGFIGLWGYNWGKTESDAAESVSQIPGDPGCPWSFFYASRDHYSAPSQRPDGLVAVENTSLDLNAAFYSGNSRVFSSVPSALRMSRLYADKNLAYLETLLGEYLKNCAWNRFVAFVQQQPAYQMEYASYDAYARGTIADLAGIMEFFFQEAASNQNIQALSLPQAINLYKKDFEYTESCHIVFDSILPLNADVNFFVPPVPKQKPPYPFTFFYYDRGCQLIFREGQMTPIEIRNYSHPPFESRYYLEKEAPSISQFHPSRDRDKLIMEFEIESAKQMPFGLVIWDDHSPFSLVSTNARLVKWIGNHLLFIRVDLEMGLNRIELSLTI